MSITIINARNPRWKTLKTNQVDSDGNEVLDSEGNPIEINLTDSDGNLVKVIDCECQWSHLGDSTQEWLPFSANQNDEELHGQQLYTAFINGDYGSIEAE